MNFMKYFNSIFQLVFSNNFSTLLLLLLTTIIAILTSTRSSYNLIVSSWNKGFFSLHSFSMQMALILILGSGIASSMWVNKFITMLTEKIRNPIQAQLIVVSIGLVSSFLNWGLGIVLPLVLVLKIAKNLKVNAPLILSGSYSSFLIWHGGLSSSVGLSLDSTTIFNKTLGLTFNDFLFSKLNIYLLLFNTIFILITNYLLASKYGCVENNISTHKEEKVYDFDFNFNVNRGFFPVLLISLFLMSTLLINKDSFNSLNLFIYIFFILFILLSGSFENVINIFKSAVEKASGILLLFPFYGGIMGLIKYTKLGEIITQSIMNSISPELLPLSTFLSSGLLNLFVPSGGGQWAIQAPIVLTVANEMSVSTLYASIAVAWGDAWTNMIQPFWAIPIIVASNIKLTEFMKFNSIFFVVSGITSGLIFLISGTY